MVSRAKDAGGCAGFGAPPPPLHVAAAQPPAQQLTATRDAVCHGRSYGVLLWELADPLADTQIPFGSLDNAKHVEVLVAKRYAEDDAFELWTQLPIGPGCDSGLRELISACVIRIAGNRPSFAALADATAGASPAGESATADRNAASPAGPAGAAIRTASNDAVAAAADASSDADSSVPSTVTPAEGKVPDMGAAGAATSEYTEPMTKAMAKAAAAAGLASNPDFGEGAEQGYVQIG